MGVFIDTSCERATRGWSTLRRDCAISRLGCKNRAERWASRLASNDVSRWQQARNNPLRNRCHSHAGHLTGHIS